MTRFVPPLIDVSMAGVVVPSQETLEVELAWHLFVFVAVAAGTETAWSGGSFLNNTAAGCAGCLFMTTSKQKQASVQYFCL